MLIITFCVLILAGTCLANPVADVEDLREYVKVIQTQIDNTIKPCENFGKYACGNLKVDRIAIAKANTNPIKQFLEKDIIINEKPETEDENMLRTLFLSCKNGSDITKIMEQVEVLNSVKTWPVTKPFSDDEIARLFGYLATIDVKGLLSIDIEELHKNNIISLNTRAEPKINTETMTTTLEKFGTISEQSLKIVEDISNLVEELRQLLGINFNEIDGKDYKLNNVQSLKEVVPHFDWDTYFTTFTNELGFDKEDFIKKPVQIRDLTKLQKIVEIIKSTDSKTVINYLVWRYLEIGLIIECEKLEQLLNHPLIIIREDKDYKKFFLGEVEAFNRFEKSFSELKSQLNKPESERTNKFIKTKKLMYGNYKIFLSGNYLTTSLGNIEINENTIYKNLINIIHVVYKDLIDNGETGVVMPLVNFILYPIMKYLGAPSKEFRPLLHSFVGANTEFWKQIMDIDDTYENRTISDGCFPFENKTKNWDNISYLTLHATYHIALQDYLHFISEHENQFKRETEILTAAGLNHAKAYMLASAQLKCEDYETGYLEDDDKLLWFFKHSKHFSDTWGCVAGDEMNKVCDDSTFVLNFAKTS